MLIRRRFIMKKKNNNKNYYVPIIVITILYELFIYVFGMYIDNWLIVFGVATAVYFAYMFVYTYKNRQKIDILIVAIFVVGVLLRTIYILDTDIYKRQHDVQKLLEHGHLDYIYTIFKSHWLPTTNKWQFYHPPFWHIIAALWLSVANLFKIEMNYAFEGIQIITLFLSLGMIIIGDKICLKLKLKCEYRYLVLALIAISPTLVIFSGSINNDCLLLFLEALCLLYLFNWYDEANYKNTIKLAIVTGLAVMTKVNGAIMAVPILYVFIKKLIDIIHNNKKEIKAYFLKIMTFGFISLPIGLWYQIRNLFKFSSQAIPAPGDWLYTGNTDFSDRFLKINFSQLFSHARLGLDNNLPSYLLKSAVFGEYKFNISRGLFLLLIVLICMIAIIFIVYSIKEMFKRNNIYINTLIILWYISVISSYIFYYKYPYGCSMDYRYIAICLLCRDVFMGYILQNMKNKYLKAFIITICMLFIFGNILYLVQI